MDEWRSALVRSAQQKTGAPEPELSGDSPAASATAGRKAKMFWIALGMLVFFVFVFVESTDMLRHHVAEEQVNVSQQPVAGPPAPDTEPGAGARFQQADADASGGLSREEVTARLPELAAKFDEIDTDRDGRITIQELQRYWDRNPVPQPATQEPQRDR